METYGWLWMLVDACGWLEDCRSDRRSDPIALEVSIAGEL